MQRIFRWLSALTLVLVMSSYCHSQITIILPPVPGSTGEDINADPTSFMFPEIFDVVEDPSGELQLTIESVSSNISSDLPNSTVNGTFSDPPFGLPVTVFGVDSGGPNVPDGSSSFESEFEEALEISFNQDIFIEQIDFDGLDNGETFLVGAEGIVDADTADFNDIFDFTDGGTSDGLFLSADDTIFLRVIGDDGVNASVSLDAITVRVAAVPEPSSLLGLLGLAGLFAVKRRRMK